MTPQRHKVPFEEGDKRVRVPWYIKKRDMETIVNVVVKRCNPPGKATVSPPPVLENLFPMTKM